MKDNKGKVGLIVYRVTLVALLFVAVISLFVNPTSSWLRDKSITSNGTPNMSVVGTIELETRTNFNFYNLTLAPDTIYTIDNLHQDIATYVNTTSNNDILDVFVRIKFITNRSELALYFDGNRTEDTTYSSACNNKWFYNSSDQYWYYIGTINSSPTMFNAGYMVDNTLTNAKKSAEVEMTFIFEGLQKPYGAYREEWTTAPNVFKTYANNVTNA